MGKYSRLLIFFLLLNSAHAQVLTVEEGAWLDPPYGNLKHPIALDDQVRPLIDFYRAPRRNDIHRMIAAQTAVKAQQSRGTCSIFSATALLESLLVLRGDYSSKIDLSEEWLEYLIVRRKTGEGSSSRENFNALLNHGSVEEELLPYIGETWESADSGPAARRCGRLEGYLLKSCLLGHRDPRLLTATDAELMDPRSSYHDPEFYRARRRALQFRNVHLKGAFPRYEVQTVEEAKALLRRGVPLTLDLDFYYGAWNHPRAEKLGIGRDEKLWEEGVVGYPEKDSLDWEKSVTERAGHSVVIVGYDDEATITSRLRMRDGSEQVFTWKGVYYFKNSWGMDRFGLRFRLDRSYYPGYGVITQRYAHELGAFFKLPLAER